MNSWSSRRKAIYLGSVFAVVAVVAFLIFWKFWYRAPTCFDNLKNGDEMGIDCGGSCTLVCTDNVLRPIVRWDPRLFEVLPGTWSILVYVENPNIETAGYRAPYTFIIYGENDQILAQREGVTVLPKNKTVGIFEGNISIPTETPPRRALFELGSNIIWQKDNLDSDDLAVTHSPLLQLNTAPRIEATVQNDSLDTLKNIELIATIFDGADNAIAASRTFVEELKSNEDSQVFFTWPRPFDLGVKTCEKPSDTVLLIDRSGSMASLGVNPPEPLSKAKAAAVSFVENIGGQNKIAVASFATGVGEPIETGLTLNKTEAISAIGSVAIQNGTTQYTNIYAALHSAWQELVSSRASDKAEKVVILLTDGQATYPRDPNGHTEADDIKYAENISLGEAIAVKASGIEVYTIGLGNNINQKFLEAVASTKGNYFFAPSVEDLLNIYKKISVQLCKEVPARIEITHKILE